MKLTQCSRVISTSDSMALANCDDPSLPKSGTRRVFDLPGMGHLATTTTHPVTAEGSNAVAPDSLFVAGISQQHHD